MYRIYYYSLGDCNLTTETCNTKAQAKKRCEWLNNPENVLQGFGKYIYKKEN